MRRNNLFIYTNLTFVRGRCCCCCCCSQCDLFCSHLNTDTFVYFFPQFNFTFGVQPRILIQNFYFVCIVHAAQTAQFVQPCLYRIVNVNRKSLHFIFAVLCVFLSVFQQTESRSVHFTIRNVFHGNESNRHRISSRKTMKFC